jgi:hypothetical protein
MKSLLCLLLVATSWAASDNPLSKPEADDGWLLLLDGESIFGWTPGPAAQWKIADGAVSSLSDGSNLRTNSAFSDFILKFDYRATTPDADCSIYLRSAVDGEPGETAYQLQIGDSKPEWPTGSIVQFFKAEDTDPAVNQWHSLEADLSGDHIVVKLDTKKITDGNNSRAKAGFIVLGCSKAGRVQFRNIKLKPLLVKSLFNGKDLSGWKSVGPPPPKKAGMLKKIVGGGGAKAKEAQWSVVGAAMHGQGGVGQLDTTAMYDDFVLQLSIRVNSKEKGDHPASGVFFRGDAGQFATGYEASVMNQHRNGKHDDQPLPDSTGGLMGLQAPRKVLSDDNQYFSETIAAYGRHIQIWINGYPVSDFQDTRAEGTAPQHDARTNAGTIGLQSPDEKANLDFRNIRIAQLPKLLGKGPAEQTVVPPPPPAVPPPSPSQPQVVMPMMPPPDPNKPKVQALMAQALATSDPHKQVEIYTQILLLDPENQVAFNGRQQAQQKIDDANAKHTQEEAQQQQQSQSESEKEVEAAAAKQKAETAFINGDLKTAHTEIGIADKSLSHDPTVADLRSRIESAIQARTRLRLLWGGVGIATVLALIAAFMASRGKKTPLLEVIEGLDKGKKYSLDQEVVHIGAIAEDGGNKNEIVVRDVERTISRFHCEIHKRNGKFYLIDCGSANGTRLDGERAEPGKPLRVKGGARLELGGTCALRLAWEKEKKR